MKLQKAIKFALLGILAILVIGALGMTLWSATGTYPAGTLAQAALESTSRVTVTQEKWITFTPVELGERGLIFYPGGLVEPTAYAPVLHQIAEEGVLVVILPMPLNLAIFNTGAADAVLDHFSHISEWTLAGHSLGGAAAAIFTSNNPDRVDALALWDSFPPGSADLSNTTMPAISIFGTTNGVTNTENFDEKRALMPENTQFIPIEGANHAQFGDYGPQKGDVAASLSLSEQHLRVVEIMLDFINP